MGELLHTVADSCRQFPTVADDHAIEGVQSSKQGGGACNPCVSVWQRPFFKGRPGWVRSSGWIWLFSSKMQSKAPHDLFCQAKEIMGRNK
jgi:hypothetical protein